MRKRTISLCTALWMVVSAGGAGAEEAAPAPGPAGPSEREKELLNRVDELEKRLWDMEQLVRKLSGVPQATQNLEGRVNEVEGKVEKIDVLEGELKRVDAVEEQLGRIEVVEVAPETFRVFWKSGLNMVSADGNFKLKIGGRLMADRVWISGDEAVEQATDVLTGGDEFRRARLYMSGDIYSNVNYKVQYDFAGGDADFKDVWVGVKNLPWGGVKGGHFKEPMGLEELTSSKYITFMERSLANALVPSRNMGTMFYNTELDDRLTWAIGGFVDTDDFATRSGEGDYSITARVTGLPIYEDKGEKLLHLGLSYSHRNVPDDELRFRARPEVHIGPRFVNTDHFAADRVDDVGVELACVWGPFSLQSEYLYAKASALEGEDPSFQGFYVFASYFLTGEHRPYKTSAAAFDRVKPKKNFGAGGAGAWELAARYSRLDLTDAAIEGGELDNFTVGLNWYLNPNTRVMLNYVRSDLDGIGEADMFMTRAQVDF